MTSLQNFIQNNPAATQGPQPGFLGKIGNTIKGYLSGVGNTVASNVKEASQAVNASASGQENPLAAGATVFKDLAGSLASPITAATAPISQATGLTSLANSASQGFVNSPTGQAVTDKLSKYPQAAGAIADTIQGGLDTSAVVGAQELPSQVNNVWAKVKGAPVDTVAARVNDATPAYDKDLIGQNTRTPEGKIVPRVNEGTGLLGRRTVNTSASEAESGAELAKLQEYPDKGTALEKSLSVGKGIGSEAEGMRAGLQAEDQATPLDTKAEVAKIQNLVKSNLPEEIHSKLGVLSPEEESMVKGMNEKMGLASDKPIDLSSPIEGRIALPKTAAGRYYGKVLDALREYNGTREGKLDLRQKIEKAFQSEGGKYAYGSDSHNALAEVNTDLRNALNQDLAQTTKNTDTQASLKRQTNLYRAKDVLENKAKDEAANEIGRFYQKHPLLHRLATRDFMRIAAQATGVGLIGSYINKALQGKQ